VVARISIPAAIYEIKEHDPARARQIQKSASDQFLENFAKGLAVTGFERTPDSGTYLFTTWDSK